MKGRWKFLLGAAAILVLGGLLAFEHGVDDASLAPTVEPAQAVTVAKIASPATTANAAAADDKPRLAAEAAADLFATRSWFVAPPPPAPIKPAAPPLPYVLTGSQRDGDVITALFLSQGERNLIVKQGDTVGGNYRLEKIAAGQAVFTYLPLQQQQTLQIGSNP